VRDAHELAVVDAVDGVAGGTHLAVNLEAAAEGGAVVRGEEAEVLPGVGGRVEGLIIAFCRVFRAEEGERRGGGGGGDQGDACAVFGELTAVVSWDRSQEVAFKNDEYETRTCQTRGVRARRMTLVPLSSVLRV